MEKTNNKFSKRLTAVMFIMSILFLASTIALIFVSGQGTFCIEYGNKKITKVAENIVLTKGESATFNCKQLYFIDTEFSLIIEPKNSFDYTVDGNIYSYADLTDLSNAFDITTKKGSFTLIIAEDFSMQNILEKLHNDKVVVLPTLDLSQKDYFTLVVTSLKGDIIKISFRIS